MRLRKLDRRGDTIVEVMMVLAVLGLALSISYATANRSLLNARQAQETSAASTLLQSQIEGLRTLSEVPRPAPSNKDIFINVAFCLQNNAGSFTVVKPLPTPSTTCSGNPLYTVSVIYCGSSGLPGYPSASCTGSYDTFIATATWPDVAGQGTDQVKMSYRAHP